MRRTFRVLLLGGASATGKTSVASELAKRFGAAHVRTDDLWIVSQSLLSPVERPALHFFARPHEALRQKVDELHRRQREVTDVLAPAIETLVAIHVARDEDAVVEGIWLSPAHAARMRDRWPDRVAAAFLDEPDQARVVAGMSARGEFEALGGFDDRERRALARLSKLYGEWLREETARQGLPLVASRPREDLAERIIAAL